MALRLALVSSVARAALMSIGFLPGCRAPAKPQPVLVTTPETTTVNSAATNNPAVAVAQQDSNRFPPPELDLPAERLHEHVDGAEAALQALGCRRLLFWRMSSPSVELEILVFNTETGARSALDKDSGAARTKNVPGDEGWTNQQVVYFRRGTAYCRLIADQPGPVAGLSERAIRVDKALLAGEIRP